MYLCDCVGPDRHGISQKIPTTEFSDQSLYTQGQNLLSRFVLLRGEGGYPLFPLRVFGQDDFPLRGEGGTPNSAKENSAKKQVF